MPVLRLKRVIFMVAEILQHLSENRVAYGLGALGVLTGLGIAIYYDRKSACKEDIRGILKQCRETDGWNDKSELKLFQWMLDVPEDQIHNCSLRKLRKIRDSIAEYLYIHLYGRDPVPPAGIVDLHNLSERLRHRRESRVRHPKAARKKRKASRKRKKGASKRKGKTMAIRGIKPNDITPELSAAQVATQRVEYEVAIRCKCGLEAIDSPQLVLKSDLDSAAGSLATLANTQGWRYDDENKQFIGPNCQ